MPIATTRRTGGDEWATRWGGGFSRSSYRFINLYLSSMKRGKRPSRRVFFSARFFIVFEISVSFRSSNWAEAGHVLELESYREAVQGNVDPAVLFAPPEAVEQAVKDVVAKAGPTGHILNLGHGKGSRSFYIFFGLVTRKRLSTAVHCFVFCVFSRPDRMSQVVQLGRLVQPG